MQNRGGYLEEPDAVTDAASERDDAASLSRRGTDQRDHRCVRCSHLQSPVAALAARSLPERRPQSWRLPSLLQQSGSFESPPPLMLLLLLIVAICALVGVAVSYGLTRIEDDHIGGGGSRCDTTIAKLELCKVFREAVERFYEKALPALCGYVRQPPTAFLPFAGANDDDECVSLVRGALRTACPNRNCDSTTVFGEITQGRLRIPISGYYYVFAQVSTQRLTARTEVVNIMLEAVRSHSEDADFSESAQNGTRAQGDAAMTTDKDQKQPEQSTEQRSVDQLTLASVTPWTSGNGGQIKAPSIFSARVVRLHAGDELRLRLLCDRSGIGSGHRCGFESVTVADAQGRYHFGAHLIAPVIER